MQLFPVGTRVRVREGVAVGAVGTVVAGEPERQSPNTICVLFDEVREVMYFPTAQLSPLSP